EQAFIITLRKISGRKFGEIADDLGVPESTVSTIYYRARNQAGGDDIHVMLASIPPQSDRPSKKPKVENGSELSSRMQKAIINKGDQKIVATVHPVENVVKKHQDPKHNYVIVQKVRPKKSKLDEEDKKQQLIFVYYNKTLKPFRGTNSYRGKQKISVLQ
ncbi:hypothetical protein K469DRAFT_710452, partial [Zopfia rhizophila CBS 207.26]